MTYENTVPYENADALPDAAPAAPAVRTAAPEEDAV